MAHLPWFPLFYFFLVIMDPMPQTQDQLNEVESILKKREIPFTRVPTTAHAAAGSARLDLLALPDDERPRMPFTKSQYLVRENPQKVAWEREVRKFLRNLSPAHGHRVAAVMIYEWVTGISVKDALELAAAARAEGKDMKGPAGDLRKINEILRFYFGKPYMTYIMGRKVPNAFRVKPGYYIRRHRPMTLTLYAEYAEGTLNP